MIDKKELRKRIVQEDALLGNRTTSFLLGNGFLMSALGVSSVEFERSVIAVLGVFMTLIWLSVGWQSRQAITVLHGIYGRVFKDDEINKAVFNIILWKRNFLGTLFGPTELMAFWLPVVLLVTWLSINFNLYFIS